jgi:MSHA biogenesis protein MshI
MRWFSSREATEQGWLAVSMQPGSLSYVHGRYAANGKPALTRCGTRALEGDYQGAERSAKELGFGRYQCSTLLAPGQYQLLLVEAPNVPRLELKTAIRWRIKDLLEYHVDDATIDVLDIPPDPAAASRAHSMYAIAARNQVIQDCIGRFEAARIALKAIEVEETAQRNIAALHETSQRGVALLHLGAANGLLTINFRGELYLARRIEIGMDQVLATDIAAREDLLGRVALEVQRTFDHFDRQYPFVAVEKLLVGPEPERTGLAEHLGRNLDIPVAPVRLGEVLGIGAGAELDAAGEWRLFHLIGAALRHEEKAL